MSPRTSLCTTGAVLLICVLHASAARAFCRAITASAPPGYDPAARGCFAAPSGDAVYELYWKNLCVGYSLQRDGSPLRHITLDQASRVVATAFAQWTSAACNGGAPGVHADDLGPVQCDHVEYNKSQPNQHVIVFRDAGWPYNDSSNTLGLTTITFDATDGEIFDADMELNSHDFALVASTPVPFGGYDLASVVTHEAGHFLGLAHSDDRAAVMFAHYRPGSTALTADDVAGICAIYPSSGQRVTSSGALSGERCDATPRHGFSTACASGDGNGPSGSSRSADTFAPPKARGCTVARGAIAGDAARDRGSWMVVVAVLAMTRGLRRRAQPRPAKQAWCRAIAPRRGRATRGRGLLVWRRLAA
jgi:hypothetical protein